MKSITYHELKEALQADKLIILGNNLHNINNQGIYRMSETGGIFRQRMSSPKVVFDKIAQIKTH